MIDLQSHALNDSLDITKDTGGFTVLERLTAEEVTDFIIQVLLAYHMRELDRLQSIIEETGTKNRWHEFWPRFQAASENNEHALSQFTQFIMAQLDGGDCVLPEGYGS